ncbi:complex I NDUFA9 subunit family protein [Marinobacter halodurans]|uniref:Complex I NDUFA9 subunit family protein n=1 Tax=Marinobacter halodurans TaxID=2528979 RepID=A0ABY1ZGK5_9GAMM|nr:complex I NDUFA9 subunit family protein [Marinobacter halodurans]TBW51255.1 complex I NDUFA9 subunit family protein [Marinobacter halodurans]
MSESLIVVFGGTGFLGARIVREALLAGHRVRIVARHPDTLPVSSPRVEYRAADLLEPASIDPALAGADAVVNAVSLFVENPPSLTFESIHVAGAALLARRCREQRVPRLIHLSGLNPDPASRSRYVSARGRGEAAVRTEFPNVTLLRPGALFGDGQGLLATLAKLSRLPVVPLFGRGDTRLQPVHVDDVARATIIAIEGPGTGGRVYELGGADTLSYRSLVQAVMFQQRRHRPLVPVPFSLWFAGAALLSVLRSPPLTRDQLILMQADNVVGKGAAGFADLGIEPRGIEDG